MIHTFLARRNNDDDNDFLWKGRKIQRYGPFLERRNRSKILTLFEKRKNKSKIWTLLGKEK